MIFDQRAENGGSQLNELFDLVFFATPRFNHLVSDLDDPRAITEKPLVFEDGSELSGKLADEDTITRVKDSRARIVGVRLYRLRVLFGFLFAALFKLIAQPGEPDELDKRLASVLASSTLVKIEAVSPFSGAVIFPAATLVVNAERRVSIVAERGANRISRSRCVAEMFPELTDRDLLNGAVKQVVVRDTVGPGRAVPNPREPDVFGPNDRVKIDRNRTGVD
jgi:hypothetical protein